MSATDSITLTVGQAIPWRASPCGFAQIVELRRVKVRICYRCQNGRPRFALVPASKVCLQQLLFQMQNPFNRGEIVRTKTFKLTTSSDRRNIFPNCTLQSQSQKLRRTMT